MGVERERKPTQRKGKAMTATNQITSGPALLAAGNQTIAATLAAATNLPSASGFERITQRQLAGLLAERRGAQAVTIIARTVPEMRKTNNPWYGRTEKVARVNGMVNWRYENAVNNQRAREGNQEPFAAEPRKWGQRIIGCPFVEYRGELYLEVKVERSIEYQYYVDGKPVDAAVIAPYLPKRQESGRQDVERPVVLRDYKLATIEQIAIGGKLFVIERGAAASVADIAAEVGLVG